MCVCVWKGEEGSETILKIEMPSEQKSIVNDPSEHLLVCLTLRMRRAYSHDTGAATARLLVAQLFLELRDPQLVECELKRCTQRK